MLFTRGPGFLGVRVGPGFFQEVVIKSGKIDPFAPFANGPKRFVDELVFLPIQDAVLRAAVEASTDLQVDIDVGDAGVVDGLLDDFTERHEMRGLHCISISSRPAFGGDFQVDGFFHEKKSQTRTWRFHHGIPWRARRSSKLSDSNWLTDHRPLISPSVTCAGAAILGFAKLCRLSAKGRACYAAEAWTTAFRSTLGAVPLEELEKFWNFQAAYISNYFGISGHAHFGYVPALDA